MIFTRTKLALATAAALAIPLAGAPAQVNDTGVVKNPVNQPVEHSLHNSAQEATDTVNDSVEAAKEATAEAIDANGEAEVTAEATATGTRDSSAAAGATAAATPADVKAGATVHDTQGGLVGTVESVDANGAVVATGKARVQIPLDSFAKNDAGLVISLTKTQLEAEAAKAS